VIAEITCSAVYNNTASDVYERPRIRLYVN